MKNDSMVSPLNLNFPPSMANKISQYCSEIMQDIT